MHQILTAFCLRCPCPPIQGDGKLRKLWGGGKATESYISGGARATELPLPPQSGDKLGKLWGGGRGKAQDHHTTGPRRGHDDLVTTSNTTGPPPTGIVHEPFWRCPDSWESANVKESSFIIISSIPGAHSGLSEIYLSKTNQSAIGGEEGG